MLHDLQNIARLLQKDLLSGQGDTIFPGEEMLRFEILQGCPFSARRRLKSRAKAGCFLFSLSSLLKTMPIGQLRPTRPKPSSLSTSLTAASATSSRSNRGCRASSGLWGQLVYSCAHFFFYQEGNCVYLFADILSPFYVTSFQCDRNSSYLAMIPFLSFAT